MSDMRTLQEAYARLRSSLSGDEKWVLEDMTCAGLEIETVKCDASVESVWQAFCDANPTQGWVQWQSAQTVFDNGVPVEDGQGLPLAAEGVVSDDETLRLALHDGQWCLWRYRHVPEEAHFLCDEVTHRAHGKNASLRYRRYWRLDAEQGMVQQSAVLAGVEEGDPQG